MGESKRKRDKVEADISAEVAPPQEAGKPVVLVRQNPGQTAETFLKRFAPLHCLEGEWMFYNRKTGAYDGLSDETIEATVYNFLAKARQTIIVKDERDGKDKETTGPFNPKAKDLSEVMKALHMKCHLSIDQFSPPCWLQKKDPDGNPRPDPRDIIVCKNGLLNIRTLKVLPHTPSFFTRTALPIDYDKDAPLPMQWLKFLKEVTRERSALVKLLQEMFGYLSSSDNEHEKVFYMIGQSRGGKGTIQKVLIALLGRNNVASPTIRSLSSQYWAWPLMTKSVGIITDMTVTDRMAVKAAASNINMLSGRDPVDVERKFLEPLTAVYLPTRCLITGNSLPDFGEHMIALANRLLVIPFDVSFKGREDVGLARRMIAEELPGILNWALAGLKALQERGHFVEPQESLDVKDDLLRKANPVRSFLDERCEIGGGSNKVVPQDKLYSVYTTWCTEVGMRAAAKKDFSEKLFEIVPHEGNAKRHRVSVNGVQVPHYIGISLKPGGGVMPDEFDFQKAMQKALDLGDSHEQAYRDALIEAGAHAPTMH